jgi:hypothetical protein
MTDMSWRTGIAEVGVDDVIIRGHRLSELIGNVSYVDMAFLLIRGDQPSAAERTMLDAILVCVADHGISPTAIIARTLASCGTPIQASMAGAMLSIADWHGGSGEEVGAILDEILAATQAGTDVSQACVAQPGARFPASVIPSTPEVTRGPCSCSASPPLRGSPAPTAICSTSSVRPSGQPPAGRTCASRMSPARLRRSCSTSAFPGRRSAES